MDNPNIFIMGKDENGEIQVLSAKNALKVWVTDENEEGKVQVILKKDAQIEIIETQIEIENGLK